MKWQLLSFVVAAHSGIMSPRDDSEKLALCPQAAKSVSQAIGGVGCSSTGSGSGSPQTSGQSNVVSSSGATNPVSVGVSPGPSAPSSASFGIVSGLPTAVPISFGVSSGPSASVPTSAGSSPVPTSGSPHTTFTAPVVATLGSGSAYTLTPGGPAVTISSGVFSYDPSGDIYVGTSRIFDPQTIGDASIHTNPSPLPSGSNTIQQQPVSSSASIQNTAPTPTMSPMTSASAGTNPGFWRLTTLTDSSTTAIYGYDFLTQYASVATPTLLTTSYAVLKPSLTTPVLTTGPVHVGSGGIILYPSPTLPKTGSTSSLAIYTNLIAPDDDSDDDDDNNSSGGGGGSGSGGSGTKRCPAILRFLCGDTGTSGSDSGSDVGTAVLHSSFY